LVNQFREDVQSFFDLFVGIEEVRRDAQAGARTPIDEDFPLG
jgi:hypothetical protein